VPDFDEFVNARGPALLRFAYLLTADAHQAEDLVQESLARAFGRWSTVGDYEAPDLYVRKIVLRQFLSWRRRMASTEVAVATPPERPAGSDLAEAVVARQHLWRLITSLPRMQRAVLVLRYYEDRDDANIAELLGCAQSTVRVHAARGLSRLRSAFPTNHTLEV